MKKSPKISQGAMKKSMKKKSSVFTSIDDLKDKYLKPIEKVQLENLTLDERVSHEYITNMVHVLCSLDKYAVTLKKSQLNINDLINQRSNCLFLNLKIGPSEFKMKFDIEFGIFLPNNIKTLFIEIAQKDSNFFTLSNRRSFLEIKNSIGDRSVRYVFPGGNIFRVVEDADKSVNRTIADAFQYHGLGIRQAALNILSHGYSSQNKAIFNCLYNFITALDESHPNNQEATMGFKNYYQGSLLAFENGLQNHLNMITNSAKRIGVNAKFIYGEKLKKSSPNEMQKSSYQSDFIDFVDCITKIGSLNVHAKHWLKLQRTSFEKIKSDYACDKFKVQLSNITKSLNDSDSKALHLARMYFTISDHIDSLTDPTCLPQTSLELDRALNLIKEDEYCDNKKWLWKNRIELVELLYSIVTEVQNITNKPNLPLDLEKVIRDAKEKSIMPTKALVHNIQKEKSAAFTRAKTNHSLSDDIHALIKCHNLIKKTCDEVNISCPGVLGSLIAAFNSTDFIDEVKQRLEEIDELMESLKQIESDIYDAYTSEKNMTIFNDTEKAFCIDLFARTSIQNLLTRDYFNFSIEYFKNRTYIETILDPKKRMALIECALDEFYSLPTDEEIMVLDSEENTITEILEQVGKERSDTLLYIKELEQEFLDLAQTVHAVPIESKLKALGLRNLIPSQFTKALESNRISLGRVNNLKLSGNINQNIENLKILENRILELQYLYQIESTDSLISLLQEKNSIQVSEPFARQFSDELKLIFEKCKEIKIEIDDQIYKIKKEENRLGSTSNNEHYKTNLHIDDLSKLKTIYGLSKGTNQDDVKLFCYFYNQKMELMRDVYDSLIEKFLKNNETPQSSYGREVLRKLKSKPLEKWRADGSQKSYDQVLKSYQLFFNKDLLLLETKMFCLYLNFCDEITLKTKQTYKNFINIFEACNTNNSAITRNVIGSIRTTVICELDAYHPLGRAEIYKKHSNSFRDEVYKITSYKVSYDKTESPNEI